MIEIYINPIAFTIAGIPVSWYGLLYLLAALVVLFWGLRERRRVKGAFGYPFGRRGNHKYGILPFDRARQ